MRYKFYYNTKGCIEINSDNIEEAKKYFNSISNKELTKNCLFECVTNIVKEKDIKKEITILSFQNYLIGYVIKKEIGYLYNEDIAYFYDKHKKYWCLVDINLYEILRFYKNKDDIIKGAIGYKDKLKDIKYTDFYQDRLKVNKGIFLEVSNNK